MTGSMAAGDLDGDGRSDLVVGEASPDGQARVVVIFGLGPPSETENEAFERGQVDEDGVVRLTDAVVLLHYLFLGGGPLRCEDAADTNDSGNLDVTDAIYLLSYLFSGGAPPPPPFGELGVDPTRDALDCERGRPREAR